MNSGPQHYEASWASLKHHPDPDWFDDAKFGIYFHWGPYSVPAFDNEWYSRNMYIKGHRAHEHHLKTYGSLDTFGHKNFIPMFTAEKFDVDEWVELFKKAGAKFAGPVTEHADGTRPWQTYGEGPTQVFEGHFSEKDNELLSAKDIRFTTKGDHLYATVMGVPYETIRINSFTGDALKGKQVKRIELLGSAEDIHFRQDNEGLSINPPQDKPSDIALSFKLEF